MNGRGDFFDDILALRGEFNGGASFLHDIITFVVYSMRGANFFRRRLFICISMLFHMSKNYCAAVVHSLYKNIHMTGGNQKISKVMGGVRIFFFRNSKFGEKTHLGNVVRNKHTKFE